MNSFAKTIGLLSVCFTASICFAQGRVKTLISRAEFTANFEINKSYPIILEGYRNPLVDRTGQYLCGAIAFTSDSTDQHLFYTFKAWRPEGGKCNFQSPTPIVFAALHECVQGAYTEKRKFSAQEIEATLPGNRVLEIQSTDGDFYVLSRCNGSPSAPSYIALSGQGSAVRELSKNIHVTNLTLEKRAFPVLQNSSAATDVLTIQLNNGWNYVILKDKKIN